MNSIYYKELRYHRIENTELHVQLTKVLSAR
jgi:hypothetical protein